MPFSTVVLAFVLAWWTRSTLRTAHRSTEVEEADLLAADGSAKSKTGAPSVPTLGPSADYEACSASRRRIVAECMHLSRICCQ